MEKKYKKTHDYKKLTEKNHDTDTQDAVEIEKFNKAKT
jgi:hypothetical protein